MLKNKERELLESPERVISIQANAVKRAFEGSTTTKVAEATSRFVCGNVYDTARSTLRGDDIVCSR